MNVVLSPFLLTVDLRFAVLEDEVATLDPMQVVATALDHRIFKLARGVLYGKYNARNLCKFTPAHLHS